MASDLRRRSSERLNWPEPPEHRGHHGFTEYRNANPGDIWSEGKPSRLGGDVLGESTTGDRLKLLDGEVMDDRARLRGGFETYVDVRRATVRGSRLLDGVDLLSNEHGRASLTKGQDDLAGKGAQTTELADNNPKVLKVAVTARE
jgi:hypothetical protein